MRKPFFFLLTFLLTLAACTAAEPDLPEETMAITLTSTVFTQGNPIPAKYTCTGVNVSPPLAWDKPPAGTQSFALILDDPDAPAGTWVHWVMYNIPGHGARPAREYPARCPPGRRQPARGELLARTGLQRPLSTLWRTPLHLQTLRPRQPARPAFRRDQSPIGQGDGRPHPGLR